jgi:hypothetical protein
MNRRMIALGLVGLALAAAGCLGSGESADEGPVGAARGAQIEPQRTYAMKQSGVMVASAWAGTTTGGAQVEYWAALPSYVSKDDREITGTPGSCAAWKRTVCSPSWSGATHFRAVYTQTTLDCGLPPGPCSPSAGAISFLGSGSYGVRDASGTDIAWNYAEGSCEYWSMYRMVTTGTYDQTTQPSGWASLGAFQADMCAKSAVPPLWYSVYYEPIADFCSTDPC